MEPPSKKRIAASRAKHGQAVGRITAGFDELGYQRDFLKPPPRPPLRLNPPPAPRGESDFGRASLTLSVLPCRSLPFKRDMAISASSRLDISTKAKPRG